MATENAADRVATLERECRSLRTWLRAVAGLAILGCGLGAWGLATPRPEPVAPASASPPVVDEVRLAVPGSGSHMALRFDPDRGLVAESPNSNRVMVFDWKERPR